MGRSFNFIPAYWPVVLLSFLAMGLIYLGPMNFAPDLQGDEPTYFSFTQLAVDTWSLDFTRKGQQGHSTFTIPFYFLTKSPWSIRLAGSLALFLAFVFLPLVGKNMAKIEHPGFSDYLLLPLLFLFMPFLYISPWNGYVDAIQFFYITLFLFFYAKKYILSAALAFGLAMAVKPFSLCLSPLLLLLAWENRKASSAWKWPAIGLLASGPLLFFGLQSWHQTGIFFNAPTIEFDPALGAIDWAYFKSNVGGFIDFFVFDTDPLLKIHYHPTLLVFSVLAMLAIGLTKRDSLALAMGASVILNLSILSLSGFWHDRYFLSSYILSILFYFIYFRHSLPVLIMFTLLQGTFFHKVKIEPNTIDSWMSISNLGGFKTLYIIFLVSSMIFLLVTRSSQKTFRS